MMPVENFELEAYYNSDNRLYGYKNQYGQIIIPPKFSTSGKFENGKALVKNKNGSSGIINKAGIYIVIPKDGITISNINGNVYVATKRSGSYRYVSALMHVSGKRLTDFKYSRISKFENGKAKTKELINSRTVDYPPARKRYLNYYYENYINTKGDILASNKKTLDVTAEYDPTHGLKLTRTYATYEEQQRADRKAARYKKRLKIAKKKRDAEVNQAKREMR